jgi:hypothetical protein
MSTDRTVERGDTAMSPGAVTRRLREMSERSDLSAARRLATKVDMSPAAVTRRLRRQAALRAACLEWGRARPVEPGPRSES